MDLSVLDVNLQTNDKTNAEQNAISKEQSTALCHLDNRVIIYD